MLDPIYVKHQLILFEAISAFEDVLASTVISILDGKSSHIAKP